MTDAVGISRPEKRCNSETEALNGARGKYVWSLIRAGVCK
jgi:hypothetical protein